MTSKSREYPARPVVGVGAVVLVERQDGGTGVVLIRRRFEPLAGCWSLPGGGLEVGETLTAGLVREIQEETGLAVEVGPVLDVFDRITCDDAGRVRFHYVLVDYVCWPAGGVLAAGSDVSEVVVADPDHLAAYALTDKTLEVIRRALDVTPRPSPSRRS